MAWERVGSVLAAAVGLGVMLYLVVRNEPFRDPNLVVMARIMLSLSIAVLGATVPGFLNVGWSGKGFVIRAGGALALFVLTFLLTPQIVQQKTHGDNSPAISGVGGNVTITNGPSGKEAQ
jgi:hypothetical protein